MPNAIDAKKIQKENWSTLMVHITRIKLRISPGFNLGTIYAGKTNAIDLQSEIERVLPIGQKNKPLAAGSGKFDLSPVWKSIERANKRSIAKNGTLKYDTLADVIGDLPAPTLHDPSDGKKITFRNLFDCAHMVAKDTVKPPIVAQENQKQLWTELSKIYASNCKGAVTVIEGVLDEYANLDKDRDMIRVELEKVMKNPNVDASSRKKAIDLVEKYFGKIPSSGSGLRKDLEKAKKELSGK